MKYFTRLFDTQPQLCFWVNLVFVSSPQWIFISSPINFLDASLVEKLFPDLEGYKLSSTSSTRELIWYDVHISRGFESHSGKLYIESNNLYSVSYLYIYILYPKLYEFCESCRWHPDETFEWKTFEHYRNMYSLL